MKRIYKRGQKNLKASQIFNQKLANQIGNAKSLTQSESESNQEEDGMPSGSIPANLITKLNDPNQIEKVLLMLANISPKISAIEFKEIFSDNFIKQLLEKLKNNEINIVDSALIAISHLLRIASFAKRSQTHFFKIELFNLVLQLNLIGQLEVLLTQIRNKKCMLLTDKEKSKINDVVVQCYRIAICLLEEIEESDIVKINNSKLTEFAFEFFKEGNEEISEICLNYLNILSECSFEFVQFIFNNQQQVLQQLTNIFNGTISQFENIQLQKSFIAGILYNIIRFCEDKNYSDQDFLNFKQNFVNQLEQFYYELLSIKIIDEASSLLHIIQHSPKYSKEYYQYQKHLIESKKSNQQQNIEAEDEQDIREEEENKINKLAEDDNNNNNLNKNTELETEIKESKAIKIWNDTVQAIQQSLTLLMQIFETDEDDPNENVNNDSFEEIDDEDDQDEDIEEEKSAQTKPLIPKSSLKHQIAEKLLCYDFFYLLFDKTQIVIDTFEFALYFSNHFEFLNSEVKQLIIYAFDVIINVVSNHYSSIISLQGSQEFLQTKIENSWMEIKKLLQLIQEKDLKEDLLSTDLSLADVVSQNLKFCQLIMEKNSQICFNMNSNEILQTVPLILQLNYEETSVIALELLARKYSGKIEYSFEENAQVCDILLSQLNNSNQNIMIVAEALNALFDVYSEENYDSVYVQKNLQYLLEQGLKPFQQAIKNQSKQWKRQNKSNYSFLNLTFKNLKAFIAYKKQHVK